MVALVSGCANLLPVPDSCRVLRAGGPGQGARSARRGGAAGALAAGRLGADHARAAGAGRIRTAGVGGLSAWFAVVPVRGGRPWRPGGRARTASLTSVRGALAWPRRHDD